MADDPSRERFSLKRWSQRKHAAAREVVPPAASAPSPAAPAPLAVPATTATASAEGAATVALPPVESLTFDADFTPFMKADVAPELKRAALKKLFADPRFNVMDGLDVYIDDYTKFEPLDAETAKSLVSARYIFDPPKTRVNEQGNVEDVPPDEAEATPPPGDGALAALPAPDDPPPTAAIPPDEPPAVAVPRTDAESDPKT